MNFPSWTNLVSLFQSTTGGSCTTSWTLHHQVFPVPDFLNEGSVYHALYGYPLSSSPSEVPFARLFIFKVNSVSDLKVMCRVICCLPCILT